MSWEEQLQQNFVYLVVKCVFTSMSQRKVHKGHKARRRRIKPVRCRKNTALTCLQ